MEEKTTNNLKHCSKCGEDKPLDDFGPNKQSKDGKQWACKKCLAKGQRERLANKQDKNKPPLKMPVAKKQKPTAKYPDLDSLIAKLLTQRASLMAEIDRINTTLSVIQERM